MKLITSSLVVATIKTPKKTVLAATTISDCNLLLQLLPYRKKGLDPVENTAKYQKNNRIHERNTLNLFMFVIYFLRFLGGFY